LFQWTSILGVKDADFVQCDRERDEDKSWTLNVEGQEANRQLAIITYRSRVRASATTRLNILTDYTVVIASSVIFATSVTKKPR
jgi:hypothetical protein